MNAPAIHSGAPAPPASPWLPAGLIVLAMVLAYANSLHGPFIFDDVPSITDNPTIRQLWPLGPALSPPSEGGITVSGRPILNLTLALNYAISGLDVWSYHALNLLIHALAGLTLFGLVRRTCLRPPLAARFQSRATPLALVVAGLWTLHPLQVESVTYVVQRAESLAGLFFLLALYAFVRAGDSPRPRVWCVLSFLACLLGAGTKEIAALIPVMVFLYDRTFVSGSFRAAWQRHRWRHVALAATWLPLAGLLAQTGGDRGNTIGFNVGVSAPNYWLTQTEAVTRYLGLSFWPHPLVFDYGKMGAPAPAALWPMALLVLALAVATLWALRHRPVVGFLGAWFLGILAPTSLVPGVLQMIVEHRMYLPLAAVIALVAGVAAVRLTRTQLLAGGALLALVAGGLTWRRNADYRDEETLWRLTLAQRPANARTYNNLGRYYYLQGRSAEAIPLYRESLRLDPAMARPHFNLGLALLRSGHPAEAIPPLAEAVRILPNYFQAQLNLGVALAQAGRPAEALAPFAVAARIDPWPSAVHFQWGVALAQLGRWAEAISHYKHCLFLDPRHAEAQGNWANALVALGLASGAIEHFETALRLRPDSADLHFNLAVALSSLDRREEALRHYAEAVRLQPDRAPAQLNLGIALGQAGRLPEAIPHLEAAVALQPQNPQFNYNLGYALLEAGRTAEARRYFETAVRLQPDFSAAQEMLRQLSEAKTP